jgi:hypothetical protein
MPFKEIHDAIGLLAREYWRKEAHQVPRTSESAAIAVKPGFLAGRPNRPGGKGRDTIRLSLGAARRHRRELLPARSGSGHPLPRLFRAPERQVAGPPAGAGFSPIEIETMSGQKDQDKLLHAMAWEAANVHLGSARAPARIAADLNSRSGKWVRTGRQGHGTATVSDWEKWKKQS